jgi:nucleoid-associated protein YgaU
MTVNVSNMSPLRFAELVTVDGVEFWNTIDLPTIPDQPGDIVHTVKSTDRLDLLAYEYYGDPVAQWVIAVANDLEILPTDLNAGDTIRIPSPRYVLTQLFKKAIK